MWNPSSTITNSIILCWVKMKSRILLDEGRLNCSSYLHHTKSFKILSKTPEGIFSMIKIEVQHKNPHLRKWNRERTECQYGHISHSPLPCLYTGVLELNSYHLLEYEFIILKYLKTFNLFFLLYFIFSNEPAFCIIICRLYF